MKGAISLYVLSLRVRAATSSQQGPSGWFSMAHLGGWGQWGVGGGGGAAAPAALPPPRALPEPLVQVQGSFSEAWTDLWPAATRTALGPWTEHLWLGFPTANGSQSNS